MTQKPLLTLFEAAELLEMSSYELKLSRQRGLPPGSLGFVENGRLVFKRADLTSSPRTSSSSSSSSEPEHIGGGWFELSDGSRVRGKEAAAKAQAQLEG